MTPPDDGKRYEIIGGELIVSPVPTLDHQDVVGHLTVWLSMFVRERQLGEAYPSLTAVRLSPHNVVQPDALIVSRDRRQILRREYVDGPPDLVLEVLSDLTAGIDLVRKRAVRDGGGAGVMDR
jgi:Uma2 family endonuclease